MKKKTKKSKQGLYILLNFRFYLSLSLFFLQISLQSCVFNQQNSQNSLNNAFSYQKNLNNKQLNQIKKVLQTPAHFGESFYVPEDNLPDKKVISLGKKLFFDTRLSANDSISCATCHQPSKAFTDGFTTAKGFRGATLPRNTMSLVNLLWQKKFFWDGRSDNLEEQSLHPLENPLEMNLSKENLVKKLKNIPEYVILFKNIFPKNKNNENLTIQNIQKALAQFERTLISANSKYDHIIQGKITPTTSEKRAIQLFFTHPIASVGIRGGNCGDCHGSHLTQLNTFHNNGLDVNYKDLGVGFWTKNEMDKGKMKAPSLRNIALTAPYMHDGRFKNLDEVLDHYNEHIKQSPALDALIIEATNEIDANSLKLTPKEKKDIILFLNMLTDSSFVRK